LSDRQAARIASQRQSAIKRLESQTLDRMLRGLPVRGTRTSLFLSQQGFASEGELYLFGTVLSRFFALYASINAFHQLDVVNTDNQERYTWTLQHDQKPLM
jgi:type VI secretion system protein ImpG